MPNTTLQQIEIPDGVKTVESSISEILLNSFDNTVTFLADARKKGSRRLDTFHVPNNAAQRKDVFVAKLSLRGQDRKVSVNPITNLDEFRELISKTEKLFVETGYWGEDAQDVKVYVAEIPAGYAARIPHIKLRHLPQKHFNEKEVTFKKVFKGGNGEEDYIYAVCPACEPRWTDLPCSSYDGKTMKSHYHFVSFKVHNETGRIVGWIIGRDIQSELIINSVADNYVLLGRPADWDNRM